jgi:hypothetical protein
MCINVYEYAKGPSRNVASASIAVEAPAAIDPVMIPTFTLFPEIDIFGGMDFDSGLDIPASTYNPDKEQWTTTTTTVITPGIDTTEQAMEIKALADNLLGATGSVLGITAAILSGSPRLVVGGAVYGDMVGRWVGSGMWNLING